VTQAVTDRQMDTQMDRWMDRHCATIRAGLASIETGANITSGFLGFLGI